MALLVPSEKRDRHEVTYLVDAKPEAARANRQLDNEALCTHEGKLDDALLWRGMRERASERAYRERHQD